MIGEHELWFKEFPKDWASKITVELNEYGVHDAYVKSEELICRVYKIFRSEIDYYNKLNGYFFKINDVKEYDEYFLRYSEQVKRLVDTAHTHVLKKLDEEQEENG